MRIAFSYFCIPFGAVLRRVQDSNLYIVFDDSFRDCCNDRSANSPNIMIASTSNASSVINFQRYGSCRNYIKCGKCRTRTYKPRSSHDTAVFKTAALPIRLIFQCVNYVTFRFKYITF